MKKIKAIWGRIIDFRGLVLVLAVATLFFAGHNPWLQQIDNALFNLSGQITTPPETKDNTVLITLPVSSAHALQKNPDLAAELIRFLEKSKTVNPAATALILDGFPQSVINNPLLKVADRLRTAVSEAKDSDNSPYPDILKLTLTLSGFGDNLAKAVIKNNILVGTKPAPPTLADAPFLNSLGNYPPYTEMTAIDQSKKTYLNLLPFTALPRITPTIEGPVIRDTDPGKSCKIIPVFSRSAADTKWPMIWKYENTFLPDLVTLLHKHITKTTDLTWVRNEGVQFDFQVIKSDFSGHIRPLFLASNWNKHAVKHFTLSEMAVSRNLDALTGKVVLIGALGDTTLDDMALTLLSLQSESTVYTPSWGIWLEKGVTALFFLYLIFLLPRLRTSLGIMLSLFIVFVCVTIQLGINQNQNLWLPLTTPTVFLILGHMLMHIKLQNLQRFRTLQQKAGEALFKLGSYYFEQHRYDHAFETLKQCTPTPKILEILFDIGMEYERKHQYNKAVNTFKYICKKEPSFKNAAKRAADISDLLQGKVKGKTDGSETISIPSFELKFTSLGRYEIEHELGRGAMGIVYLGRDPKISRNVAIKTMDFTMAQAIEGGLDAVKERFFREAEAIGRLNHPNIVTVFDVGEEEDLAFIAMDYVSGKTLKSFTESANLLPIPLVYKLTVQVAEALDYAHSQNVIHRDIKPGNIIYNETEKLVKVTDFGIAKFTDTTQTLTRSIQGSPSYMSPEQLKQSKVDGRADIFSLGVTFFQMLTGKFPFTGEDLAGITYQITNAKHPDIRDLRPELPASAATIVNKALQKSPEKRFQTAQKMAQALRKGAPQ